MKKEQRFAVQELRAAGNDKAPKIEGYAALFGTVADIGSFSEVIQKGAFARTLASNDNVFCLFNHNEDLVLGRKSAGNLTLSEDEKGLKFSCTLPDTTVARDVYANLRAGNINQCSFGFCIANPQNDEAWSVLPDGTMLRTLLNVILVDVSVVTYPAYSGTSAAARNILPDDLEARMSAAQRTTSDSTGEPVPFVNLGKDKRSEDPFNSVDEANGIINWADGEDEDRAADSPVTNKLRATQGFAFVSNNGEKRSDYLLPHHQVRSGELVHSQMGALRAMMNFKNGSVAIPAQHRSAVESHLQAELAYFLPSNVDADGDEDERMKSRLQFLNVL